MRETVFICCAIGFVAVATLLHGAPATAQSEIETRLTGTWLGVSGHWGTENHAELYRFTFMANHEVKVTIDKETITGTYRIDISKEPFQMDFIFEIKGGKFTPLTIFDFPKEDSLRIAEWDPSFRRKRFRPGITFMREESSNLTLRGTR
ncbi:MAG: hypothetical protein K8S27_04465 [Candidatus Omnitrophica bacterium]|nr:hypothetical protein [Candidatus Omnitrophota bacterium]